MRRKKSNVFWRERDGRAAHARNSAACDADADEAVVEHKSSKPLPKAAGEAPEECDGDAEPAVRKSSDFKSARRSAAESLGERVSLHDATLKAGKPSRRAAAEASAGPAYRESRPRSSDAESRTATAHLPAMAMAAALQPPAPSRFTTRPSLAVQTLRRLLPSTTRTAATARARPHPPRATAARPTPTTTPTATTRSCSR